MEKDVKQGYQGVEFDKMEESFNAIIANTLTEIETIALRAQDQFNNSLKCMKLAVNLKNEMVEMLDRESGGPDIEWLTAEEMQDAAREGLEARKARKNDNRHPEEIEAERELARKRRIESQKVS